MERRPGGDPDEVVTSAVLNSTLIVTMNRPASRNAVTVAMAQQLADAMDRLDSDDALRVGVLTGAGAHFCAGMDLKAFAAGELPFIEGRGFAGLTERPPSKPLVAAVEGWALAGGMELVLACDLAVASSSARFGVPEVKRGLVAGAGGALTLARRIPRAVAMELLLLGDPIEADRAFELGLVNRVVETGQALDEALRLAALIARNGPGALRATKRIASVVSERDWSRQDAEVEEVFASGEAAEGARAFMERRPPDWSVAPPDLRDGA